MRRARRDGRGRALRALAAVLLLGAGPARAAAAPAPARGREIVLLQELTQASAAGLPLDELRTALGALPGGLGPQDRLAIVVFDAQARVLQRLDDPPAELAKKLAGLRLCPSGPTCFESDPVAAIRAARELFKGRAAGPERQILLVSSGAPCQVEESGPRPKAGAARAHGVGALDVVKVAREARQAGIRVGSILVPRDGGSVCLPRGGQLDPRGNLIARDYSAALTGGAPALLLGEGRSFPDLLAAALAPTEGASPR